MPLPCMFDCSSQCCVLRAVLVLVYPHSNKPFCLVCLPAVIPHSRPRRQIRRPVALSDCSSETLGSSFGDEDHNSIQDSDSAVEHQQHLDDADLDDLDCSSDDDGDKRHPIRAHGKGSKARIITKNSLREVYHLPISRAAAHLDVGSTVLKKYCRKFNIQRWPYRKINSLHKLIDAVEGYEKSSGNTRQCAPVLQELRWE